MENQAVPVERVDNTIHANANVQANANAPVGANVQADANNHPDAILDMLGAKEEEPPRNRFEAGLIDFAEHFSCYDLLLGFNMYMQHKVRNACILLYYISIWFVFMSFCLFLGFNWVFSIVALAQESYGTVERAFYICTIATFFALWFSNIAMDRYQKRWGIKSNFGEFHIVAVLFVATMILGIIAKDDINEPFGQIVFWTYVAISCYAAQRGLHKTFLDIYEKF